MKEKEKNKTKNNLSNQKKKNWLVAKTDKKRNWLRDR